MIIRTYFKILFSSFIIVFLAILQSQSAYSQSRKAFVVGVSHYNPKNGIAKLNAPVNDAEQIRVSLQQRHIDFFVDIATNEKVKNKEAFQAAFQEFLDKIQPGDQVLFYFSGHGYYVPGKGNYYMLPDSKSRDSYIQGLKNAEARLLDTKDKKDQSYQQWLSTVAVSERDIERQIAAKNASAIIIIADACRNLVKGTKGAKLEDAKSTLKVPTTTNRGTFRLYSAGEGQISLDSLLKLPAKKTVDVKKKKKRRKKAQKRATSLFTRVLLKELKVPGQEISILAAQVRISVRDIARERGQLQIPDFLDHPNNTKFYFWQGNFREELDAFCKTAQAEFAQLRYAVLSGSVGRDRLEEKRIQLSRCKDFGNYGEQIEEMMRMEAQGTGAISAKFGRLLDEFKSDDPSKNCDVKGSSPLDPNRPRDILKLEIQTVALSSITGQMDPVAAEKMIDRVVQACDVATQQRGRVARYKYNLGRALYALAKISKGAEKEKALQRASVQFDEAVNLGYAAAYNDLALLHQNGEYYKRGSNFRELPNREIAVELFRKGAQLGHIVAQYNYGMAHINGGLGIKTRNERKAYAEAFDWLSRASERGFVPAMIETARALHDGRGIDIKPANTKKAVELLKIAASRGSWEAMYWLGHYFQTSLIIRDWDRAIVWHARAAEAGNTRSQEALAIMLTSGRGVPAPQREAAGRYWRLAAEAGSMRAQMQLARLLSDGKIPFRPLLKDAQDGGASEIKNLYLSAFSRGEISAGYELAFLYREGFPKGRGSKAIPISAEKAINMFFDTIEKVKSAEPGSAQANPVFKFRSAFAIIDMYDKGLAKRIDGTSVLSEDQIDLLRKEYGDGSELYRVKVHNLGKINCGNTTDHNIRYPWFFVWNWKNDVPPTDEQFEWWTQHHKCLQKIRKAENDQQKFSRKRIRRLKENEVGISSRIKKVILREFKAARRDAKRKGPKARTFTQRVVTLVRKKAGSRRR